MLKNYQFGKYKPQKSGLKIRRPIERYIMRGATIGFTAFLATLLSASILAPVEATDAAEVLLSAQTNGSTVSIETSDTPVNLSLTTGSAGAIQAVPDTVTVTSGSSGYQLYLSTNGSETALTRTDGNTGSIPTLSSSGNPIAISTPTNLQNNTWGFALSGSSSHLTTTAFSTNDYTDPTNASNKFAGLPAKGNDVKIATSSSTTNAEPITVYYGAKVTSAIPSGTYSNTVVYTAIGNANAENMASVTPERTNKISGGEELIISTPSTTALSSIASDGINVTVGDMTCTSPVATKNDNGTGALTNITCTAPALATGWHEVVANITTTAGTTETYIVNPGIEYYTEDGIMAMQDFTQNMCMEMNVLDTITLIDNRDDNTYKVTRQRDGNCWMVQNLRLGNSVFGTTDTLTLTSADSDVTTDFTIPSDVVTTNLSPSDINTKYIYTRKNTNGETLYGNNYNWYTATAGTGTASLGYNATASSSICPKGWKLPPTSGNGSFLTLIQSTVKNADGSNYTGQQESQGSSSLIYINQFKSSPLDFAMEGNVARYWSRASYSSDKAFDFGFYNNGFFNLKDYSYKSEGYFSRCVFIIPSSMQSFTTTMCSNMETAKTITLIDNRDWNDYKVTKQADNNCWMTQNLRLGTINNGTGIQNVTLTTANTDLTSGTADTSLVVLGSGETLSDRIQTSANPTGDWSNPIDAYHVYSFAGTANATEYGNLYNWYTATASSGTTALANGNAPSSICPANWKLPPNSGNGSYTILMHSTVKNPDGSAMTMTASATSSATTFYTTQFASAPLNFIRAGHYTNMPSNANWVGFYWSRTAYSVDGAIWFYFLPQGEFAFSDAYSSRKYAGNSVRCAFIP